MRPFCLIFTIAMLVALPDSAADEGGRAFTIRVTDAETGRPVPLVELRTVHQTHFVTDNAGVVAVFDPELLGREVWFHVESHGYEVPKDGFGYRGKRWLLQPGGRGELRIKRTNIAERLYRITGAGRYDHSLRAGIDVPSNDAEGRGGVFGCDSVLNAIYRGKLFWIWGDTNIVRYPLGNFHSTGATSLLPAEGGRDPDLGIELDYFLKEDENFVRGMAPIPGEGPTWLTGLTSLRDKDGNEHLVATYQKVRGFLDVYETGLCEFDEDSGTFEKTLAFPPGQELLPNGHPFRFEDDDGQEWMIYADPLPTMKIRASYEEWKNPKNYQTVETTCEFKDPSTGEPVQPHRGSVAWNEHRRRWLMVFTESKKGGENSQLGEVWYAESRSPFGPWDRCVKVVTHNRYSFYNPKQHPYFVKEGAAGRFIYFEGTYTKMFSRAPAPTPKYDYNQILYRLDLDDERLEPGRMNNEQR